MSKKRAEQRTIEMTESVTDARVRVDVAAEVPVPPLVAAFTLRLALAARNNEDLDEDELQAMVQSVADEMSGDA